MKPVTMLLVSIAALGCGGRSPEATTARTQTTQTTQISTTTEITSAVAPSGLEPRRVRERVERGVAEVVERCGELQVATDRYETLLHLDIDPSGSVRNAEAHGTHSRLDACIAEVARTWTFDRPGARTISNTRLVLERPSRRAAP